jgi:hypothetical protein
MGAPRSPQRTWAENDGAQPLRRSCKAGKKRWLRSTSSCKEQKALEETIFGPGALWRTWGTRPIPWMFVLDRQFSVEIPR